MSRHTGKITTVDDLVARGLVAEAHRSDLEAVATRYAVALTAELAHLINSDDPNDPIARQFVPDARELETHPAELGDPIGDRIKSPAPGVVHRYPDRVLLKIASVCPVYCRFCFRREMVGPENGEALSATDFKAALAYIGENPGIWEVILTGGDPFVLSPRRLREATEALSHIGHVRILRWHTRVPVVDPGRITSELISALKATQQTVFVGLHVNHPSELTANSRAAIAALVDAGVPMVSQTVLLRGVNDDASTLEALMRALVELRVKPYYLHHGDLAPGTGHFRTTVEQGQTLMRELRRRLSGLALPTYVLDIPGAHGKVPLERYATQAGEGKYAISDSRGDSHDYDDCCAAPDTP